MRRRRWLPAHDRGFSHSVDAGSSRVAVKLYRTPTGDPLPP